MSELNDLARRFNLSEDDPLLLVARGNAKLEGKVELWSRTIVQLLDLVRVQNEQIVKTAGQSEKLSGSLNQFEKELLDFKIQFKKQNQILERLTPAAAELNQIKESLKTLKTSQTEQNSEIQENLQKDRNANRRLYPFLLAGLIGLIVIQLAQIAFYQSQLGSLKERSDWALTKLERLEKRAK